MSSSYEIADRGYGKTGVSVLKIKRRGDYHEIKELEVATELKLNSVKDFTHGDNGDIIATDTQKNTVYCLAKKHELNSIEEFGLYICNYFLTTHGHVMSVKVNIDEAPWQRTKHNGVEHSHSFILSPDCVRFCEVYQARGEPPKVSAGLKQMKVLKTTKSGFVGFIKDQYTSLKDVTDRCFSTVVYSKYKFDTLRGVDYNSVWNTVKKVIIDTFAGPPDKGAFSSSVQQTLYQAEELALNKVPQLGYIEMNLPNVHYFTVNMAPFGIQNKDEILMPTDKPSGNIRAALSRKVKAKL